MTDANECRIELVTQVHMLASQIENTLYAFGKDVEARKQAEGAIAHALKVAARWNWNGPWSATNAEAFAEKTARNARVMARYEELMTEGKHGHYESMFRVVHDEVERALAKAGVQP